MKVTTATILFIFCLNRVYAQLLPVYDSALENLKEEDVNSVNFWRQIWKFVGDNIDTQKQQRLVENSFGIVENNKVNFEKHQVWKVFLKTSDHIDAMRELLQKDLSLDLWSKLPNPQYLSKNPKSGEILIRVPQQSQSTLADLLVLANPPIDHSVAMNNLQSLINREQMPEEFSFSDMIQKVIGLKKHTPLIPKKYLAYFTKYHTYSQILDFINDLRDDYPDNVKKSVIGRTYEGRAQYAIRIGGKGLGEIGKKQFVFFGGEHAREWIGPASVQFLATSLLHHYGQDDQITQILDTFDFVMVPVLNVDGYVFTHEKNRMWRKNRQPNQIPFCVGTDINRNWGYKWGEAGSSSNPCSDIYSGGFAFSSPEISNLAKYTKQQGGNVVAWIDFHAFSQLWMYPYGAECGVKPEDDAKLLEAGKVATAALKRVHGKSFAVGSICEIIYPASGSSTDWAYKLANVTYAYGVELRDTGDHGFLLPPDQIIPSGEELFDAVVAFSDYIKKDLAI